MPVGAHKWINSHYLFFFKSGYKLIPAIAYLKKNSHSILAKEAQFLISWILLSKLKQKVICISLWPFYIKKYKQHLGHAAIDPLKDKWCQAVLICQKNFNFVYFFSNPTWCQLPFSWPNNIDIWCQFLFITAPRWCISQNF